MRRQGQYADSSMNAAVNAQMHHISGHRMQHSSGMNHFPGRAESLPSDDEYLSSKPEGQWQWDRDGPMGTNSSSSHGYREGNDSSQPVFQGQRSDPKMLTEKQVNADPRSQSHEQEMEAGYDDGSFPQTFEGLERKFLEDIMKLTKEHDNAEDAENARHRERLNEINGQYQEKLLSIRARQVAMRDDFLRREQQIRHQQYQQAYLSSYQGSGGADPHHGFGSATAAAAAALGEGPRSYGGGQFNSYRERQQLSGSGGGRGRGFESRVPYHGGGRAYGSNSRYY
ncbi:unnamed protein product [Spirodela intermedia]|uniref:Uncharacterized protein n=1 Tax=Spirodela intermedia TaxID=51605 RepID=A0A7I8KLV5_SPIIN|nr:unnamed protein product [Spirodela intermedia]